MWENANNSYATKRDNVPNIKETLEMSKKQSTSRNMGRDYKQLTKTDKQKGNINEILHVQKDVQPHSQ